MQALAPQIIYQDENIIVVDKPSGMTVNRSETTRDEVTLQDWVETEYQISKSKNQREEDSEFFARSGIVHRLDKETSGLLLVAKTPNVFVDLQAQFKARTVKKIYIALAHGLVVPAEGTIRAPVGRLPWNRKQFGIVAGGREAITKYKTISNFKCQISLRPELRARANVKYDELTLLELYPETGRTHQIRVHLKYIGHPIFADFLYAGRKTAREDRRLLSRVFLHAFSLRFTHPFTQKEVQFTSDLPHDLITALTRFEKTEPHSVAEKAQIKV